MGAFERLKGGRWANRAAVAAALAWAVGGSPLLGAQAPVHFGSPTPTPVSMTVAGVLTVAGGTPAAGTEIAVFTPGGRVCGAAVADPASGRFILHVYGDDDATPGQVEGLTAGAAVTFTVYDPLRAGEVPHADLTVTAGIVRFADRLSLRADVAVPASADADGDGVPDAADACPGTLAGSAVDTEGCSAAQRDDDQDGVVNAADAFPTDPAASVDTDGDGAPDAWNPGMDASDSTTSLVLDAFPSNPAEWVDTDGDGTGDNADLDDDGDGFSDADELAAGSNSLDPASTPPTARPAQPVILSLTPDPLAPLTSFRATLSPFQDPDDPSGTPAAVEWSFHDATLEHELGLVSFRLEGITVPPLELPAGLLSAGTRVFASVRYVDADGLRSDWSDLYGVDLPADPADLDGDGLEDRAEVAEGTDLDGDGIDDHEEELTAFREPEGGALVGLELDAGRLERLYVTRLSELPQEEQPPHAMPYGLYSFRVAGLTVGGTVRVTFHLPEPLPATALWYKVRPGAAPEDFTGRALIDGTRVTLRVTDGGAGDADGVDNGVVIDPGGPAIPTAPSSESSGGGGGGGCFLHGLDALAPL